MTDDEFVQAFERCELPDGFHHRDHVRLAWIYLGRAPVLDAIARFRDGLRHFAAAKGQPGLYHETITWAFLLLIHERIARRPAETWTDFAAANPDLLTWQPSVLATYYTPETLSSELARRTFLLPDRLAAAT